MNKNSSTSVISLFMIILMSSISSCVTDKNIMTVTGAKKGQSNGNEEGIANVTSINHISDQLVIQGTNLAGTTSVSLGVHSLNVISLTATQLIVDSGAIVGIAFGAAMNLVITNAAGASPPVAVTFSANNGSILSAHLAVGSVDSSALATNSITNIKISNGAVDSAKLNLTGASGQFLQFDGAVWKGVDLSGLTYVGAWDASSSAPAAGCGGGTKGDYYIVSNAGAVNLSGITSWSVGDWAICSSTGTWQKIINSGGITTISGLTDVNLTAPALDDILVYDGTKWINSKTKLSKLSDVDLTGLATNEVLTYDGTKFVTTSIKSTIISEGQLDNSHISGLASSKLTGALPALDGSALTNLTIPAATDVTKLPLTGGTLTGDLTMGANNIITSGNIDGVDVSTLSSSVGTNSTNIATNNTSIGTNSTNITSNTGAIASLSYEPPLTAGTASQYYKGNKTWANFESSVLGTLLAGYTKAGSASAVLVGDTISQALGKLEYKVDNADSVAFLKDGTVAMTGNLNLGASKLVGNGGTNGISITSTGNIGIGMSGATSILQISGGSVTTAFSSIASLTVDFSTANVISTSAGAGTLSLNNMKDGTSYTLIIKNTGDYILSGSGVTTWRCAPSCAADTVSNISGHVVVTILKAGVNAYVSYITDL